MRSFTLLPAQQGEQIWKMAMECIMGCVPFSFFENEHFCDAASTIGITLQSRKILATTVLGSIFKLGAEKLAAAKFIDASSDGWRKRHCEQGSVLMNFYASTPTGALFVEALNCAYLRKYGAAIAGVFQKQAEVMCAGRITRLSGWILDNTMVHWRHAAFAGGSPRVDHAWLPCSRTLSCDEGLHLIHQGKRPERW
jgi:hypothetical protein